jgi:AcrR family transcriptional regulator
MKRRGLSRARIVAKAVDLADRDGLHAVTLRGLAADLGVHVTSLYNHVATKEALLDAVMEQLVAEARLPASGVAWEEWVRHFASAIRSVARRHPGASEVFHHRPLQGADAAASVEAALAAFRSAGFDVVEAYSAVKATSHAVLGAALEDVAQTRTPGLRTDVARLPLERFPNLHAAYTLRAKADSWDYLVDGLIAGFAANHDRVATRDRHAVASRRGRTR